MSNNSAGDDGPAIPGYCNRSIEMTNNNNIDDDDVELKHDLHPSTSQKINRSVDIIDGFTFLSFANLADLNKVHEEQRTQLLCPESDTNFCTPTKSTGSGTKKPRRRRTEKLLKANGQQDSSMTDLKVDDENFYSTTTVGSSCGVSTSVNNKTSPSPCTTTATSAADYTNDSSNSCSFGQRQSSTYNTVININNGVIRSTDEVGDTNFKELCNSRGAEGRHFANNLKNLANDYVAVQPLLCQQDIASSSRDQASFMQHSSSKSVGSPAKSDSELVCHFSSCATVISSNIENSNNPLKQPSDNDNNHNTNNNIAGNNLRDTEPPAVVDEGASAKPTMSTKHIKLKNDRTPADENDASGNNSHLRDANHVKRRKTEFVSTAGDNVTYGRQASPCDAKSLISPSVSDVAKSVISYASNVQGGESGDDRLKKVDTVLQCTGATIPTRILSPCSAANGSLTSGKPHSKLVNRNARSHAELNQVDTNNDSNNLSLVSPKKETIPLAPDNPGHYSTHSVRLLTNRDSRPPNLDVYKNDPPQVQQPQHHFSSFPTYQSLKQTMPPQASPHFPPFLAPMNAAGFHNNGMILPFNGAIPRLPLFPIDTQSTSAVFNQTVAPSILPLRNKGKWCALHVQIAWDIHNKTKQQQQLKKDKATVQSTVEPGANFHLSDSISKDFRVTNSSAATIPRDSSQDHRCHPSAKMSNNPQTSDANSLSISKDVPSLQQQHHHHHHHHHRDRSNQVQNQHHHRHAEKRKEKQVTPDPNAKRLLTTSDNQQDHHKTLSNVNPRLKTAAPNSFNLTSANQNAFHHQSGTMDQSATMATKATPPDPPASNQQNLAPPPPADVAFDAAMNSLRMAGGGATGIGLFGAGPHMMPGVCSTIYPAANLAPPDACYSQAAAAFALLQSQFNPMPTAAGSPLMQGPPLPFAASDLLRLRAPFMNHTASGTPMGLTSFDPQISALAAFYSNFLQHRELVEPRNRQFNTSLPTMHPAQLSGHNSFGANPSLTIFNQELINLHRQVLGSAAAAAAAPSYQQSLMTAPGAASGPAAAAGLLDPTTREILTQLAMANGFSPGLRPTSLPLNQSTPVHTQDRTLVNGHHYGAANNFNLLAAGAAAARSLDLSSGTTAANTNNNNILAAKCLSSPFSSTLQHMAHRTDFLMQHSGAGQPQQQPLSLAALNAQSHTLHNR